MPDDTNPSPEAEALARVMWPDMIDVLIPTVGRADRLASVAANIHDATEVEHRVVFILEEDDHDSWKAYLTESGTIRIPNAHEPNYAGACLTGYEQSDAPYLFCGADDLRFHRGWDHHALATMTALPHLRVVGTNDLCNPYVSAGMHSTHSLVDRRYLDEVGGTVDAGPGSFLPTCYTHQFTDTEFIGTAKMRAVFAPCMDSVVEHLHWSLGLTPEDATTAKTIAHLDDDGRLYDERKDLWCNLSR